MYGAPVSLAREAADALETGRWNGLLSRAMASAWAPIAARSLVRPAVIPSSIAVVCVGGATLGGSGKTRLAIACARELGTEGASVALVGHAYRAAPRSARVVSTDDRIEDVGDEALVCARSLVGKAVVVVGPTRQAAIDHAVQYAPDVIVLDGPLRIRGHASTLSLLAVDATRPWGSGRLPPSGDLRATRELLLATADHVVSVDATPSHVRWPGKVDEEPLSSLRGVRVGLFTAIARPDRLVRGLLAQGVRPLEIVSVNDHGPARGARFDQRVDVWVATEKCALHLSQAPLRAPLLVLPDRLALPLPVRSALANLPAPRRSAGRVGDPPT